MKIFGERLKELREESGLTQTEFAKAFGASKQNVGRWEKSIHEPDLDTVVRLAVFFKVPTDYLLGLIKYEDL